MKNRLCFVFFTLSVFLISANWAHAQSPDSSKIGIGWEFNEDGNAEGWQLYSSLSDLIVSDGCLKATVSGFNPSLTGPEFELSAEAFGFIAVRMRLVGASKATLSWKTTDNVSAFNSFSVVGDSAFHEYQVPVHRNANWKGTIQKITWFAIYAENASQIEIDYIRIIAVGPRLELTLFKALRTLMKPGQPVPVIGVVKNTGDDISESFAIDLMLPEQVDLISGERTMTGTGFEVDQEDSLQWTLVPQDTGRFSVRLVITESRGDSAEALKTEYELRLPVVATAFELDKLLVSAWSPPAQTDSDYTYYRDANFELILSLAANESAVAFAENYGMQCMVRIGSVISEHVYLRAPDNERPPDLTSQDLARLDGIIDKFRDSPSVIGYYITDEPNAFAYPNLAKVVEYLHQKDPERLAFINLFPNYASETQLGTRTYEEHVESYMDIVKPEFLSYDHYHFFNGYNGQDYFYNLGVIHKYAVRYDIPFCNIIQAIGWDVGNWRIPSHGEERWLVYSSLAYGAKAIVYFHWGTDWGVLASPKRDDLYAIIQQLNGEMQALSPVLMRLKSRAVYHSLNVPRGAELLPDNELVKTVSGNADLVVGFFTDDMQQDYLFLMNKDYKQEITARVTLNSAIGKLETFDTGSAAWRDVSFENINEGGQFDWTFVAGGGALFKVETISRVGNSRLERQPACFSCFQNYPNPFNATTKICYRLGNPASVKLTVYDISGRQVSVLVDDRQPAGKYQLEFDGNDMASGVYMCNFRVGSAIENRKMLLLK